MLKKNGENLENSPPSGFQGENLIRPKIVQWYIAVSAIVLLLGGFMSYTLLRDWAAGAYGNLSEIMLLPVELLLVLTLPVYVGVLIKYFRSPQAGRAGRWLSLVVLLVGASPWITQKAYDVYLQQASAEYARTHPPTPVPLGPVAMTEAEALDLIDHCHVKGIIKRRDAVYLQLDQAPAHDSSGHPKEMAPLASWPGLKAEVDKVNGATLGKCPDSTWSDYAPQVSPK